VRTRDGCGIGVRAGKSGQLGNTKPPRRRGGKRSGGERILTLDAQRFLEKTERRLVTTEGSENYKQTDKMEFFSEPRARETMIHDSKNNTGIGGAGAKESQSRTSKTNYLIKGLPNPEGTGERWGNCQSALELQGD